MPGSDTDANRKPGNYRGVRVGSPLRAPTRGLCHGVHLAPHALTVVFAALAAPGPRLGDQSGISGYRCAELAGERSTSMFRRGHRRGLRGSR